MGNPRTLMSCWQLVEKIPSLISSLQVDTCRIERPITSIFPPPCWNFNFLFQQASHWYIVDVSSPSPKFNDLHTRTSFLASPGHDFCGISNTATLPLQNGGMEAIIDVASYGLIPTTSI